MCVRVCVCGRLYTFRASMYTLSHAKSHRNHCVTAAPAVASTRAPPHDDDGGGGGDGGGDDDCDDDVMMCVRVSVCAVEECLQPHRVIITVIAR